MSKQNDNYWLMYCDYSSVPSESDRCPICYETLSSELYDTMAGQVCEGIEQCFECGFEEHFFFGNTRLSFQYGHSNPIEVQYDYQLDRNRVEELTDSFESKARSIYGIEFRRQRLNK